MRTLLIIVTMAMLLTACGTKGRLYIPEQQYPQPTPAKSN